MEMFFFFLLNVLSMVVSQGYYTVVPTIPSVLATVAISFLLRGWYLTHSFETRLWGKKSKYLLSMPQTPHTTYHV